MVVERLEDAGLRQHGAVRAHVARGPDELPGRQVERLEPAVDSELPARRTDDYAIAHDQRRHGDRLAAREVGDWYVPDFLAGLRIDRDGVTVEQVVDDLAVGVDGAAVDRVAAGDAERRRIHVGAVFPPERIVFLRQVEGVEHVRIWRDHVHRVVHHQRLTFVAAEHAGREVPDRSQLADVRGGDLVEAAEARGGEILARPGPLAVVVRLQRSRRQAGEHEQRAKPQSRLAICDLGQVGSSCQEGPHLA